MIRTARQHVRPPDPAEPVHAVVLVLPGGRARSMAPARRRHLAYQRMRLFAAAIHRAVAGHGVAVWQVRYRVRGWNGPARDPVRDARWALGEIHRVHPGVPIVLVGHSMGGRAALYASDDDAVVGVCAVAPWIEPRDPIEHLAGKLLVIAHGDRDQMTDPDASRRYAARAAALGATVAYFDVVGDAHAMMRRREDWHRVARDTVIVALGLDLPTTQLVDVLAAPPAQRLGVPLVALTTPSDVPDTSSAAA
jgi:predicted alpha/beta-hydrolase family hydrolase